MKIAARALAMKAEGIDLIDFSVGEPDIPAPENIKLAAIESINKDIIKYTANVGLPSLRKAIAEKLKNENGLEYSPEQIIVSNGGKQAIFNVIMALIEEGDEVIIPAPFYVSYPEMVRIAGGSPVILNAKETNDFKVTPEELSAAITPKTKALLLCSPSNPTGCCYTKEELSALGKVIENEDIYVISDEIYEKLLFEDFPFASIASVSEKMKLKTIVVNGVSKAYSMTGWRLGYAAGPANVIEGAARIQSHNTSNASTVSQYAALEALTGPQDFPRMLRDTYRKRRDLIVEKLKGIPGITCSKPTGAFYVFPNVSSYFGKEYQGTFIRNSYGLAHYLLSEAKVAVVPGEAFGNDNYIRISYSTAEENIIEGIKRIAEALEKLQTPEKVKIFQLSNTKTATKRQVELESSITREQRDALAAEAEAYLKNKNYFVWNAHINGVVVQLRTNIPHLYDFWVENWYPAQLGRNEKPGGIIYAIDGVVGREALAFYNSETKTGLLFNTDFYGSLRSLAFGLVTDFGENGGDFHGIRGMSAVCRGKGFVMIGPRGTRKTDIFYGLLNDLSFTLHSSDMIYVKYNKKYPAAVNPERKIYIPTNVSAVVPKLTEMFDLSKCENVVDKSTECETRKCRETNDCRMDKGIPYCFKASADSYAMLDPYWIGGMHRHVKTMDIRTVFILQSEGNSPVVSTLNAEEAIAILERGFPADTLASQPVPFYNNHLLFNTQERIGLQKEYYTKLFSKTNCYAINIAQAEVEELREKIIECLK